ncbi:MAG: hypothetical protein AAB360_03440 [Patescibacteria group bacterium]
MKSNKEFFEQEVKICQEHLQNGGCNWGKCVDCGVIPLLFKIFKGKLIEDKDEIKRIKKELGWN